MMPDDPEARAYFIIFLILVAIVVLLLAVTGWALNALDRADRRTVKAEARYIYLDHALIQAKAALASWRDWDRSRLNTATQSMRIAPKPEPAQRPGLSDTTGDIT